MRTIVLASCLSLAALGAQAKTALRDVGEISEGLIAVGIAYEISERCDSISARLFRGIGYLNALKNRARELGYSEAEIDAYVEDDAEKDRLEDIARDRLRQKGAVEGDEASYCRVGRSEIEAESAIGQLLR